MVIIKIGGGDAINVAGVVADLVELHDRYIIVHGANAYRDALAERLRQPKRTLTSVSGYSSVYSDAAAIDLLMMAYAGLRNKRIVELCQQNGINAVGLSGLDGRLVQGRRNKGVRIRENGKLKIVRDFSGKPQQVNTELLKLLLENDYVPVLCVPIADEKGFAINSENDDIINVIQSDFKAEKIIQLIEAPGFLENVADPDSLLKTMAQTELETREAQVQGRMKRKMLALRKLFENGAASVIISDGRTEHPVKDALDGKGTIIA
jgi:acetylglutamate/LysW-gamma-L-alpha-aminoadipate kinase